MFRHGLYHKLYGGWRDFSSHFSVLSDSRRLLDEQCLLAAEHVCPRGQLVGSYSSRECSGCLCFHYASTGGRLHSLPFNRHEMSCGRAEHPGSTRFDLYSRRLRSEFATSGWLRHLRLGQHELSDPNQCYSWQSDFQPIVDIYLYQWSNNHRLVYCQHCQRSRRRRGLHN